MRLPVQLRDGMVLALTVVATYLNAVTAVRNMAGSIGSMHGSGV